MLMMALPMTFHVAVADVSHIYGRSWSRESYISDTSNTPAYSQCVHSNLNTNEDMCVTLGAYAYYDTNSQTPVYNYGNWHFMGFAGNSTSTSYDAPVSIQLPLIGTYCLDYGLGSQYYNNYNIYSGPTWTNGYYYYLPHEDTATWESLNGYCSVVSMQVYNSNLDDRTSIAGITEGQFYYNDASTTYYYYWAYTQLPPGRYIPGGIDPFAFLTAHNYANGGDW
jgi:hypothetical protein